VDHILKTFQEHKNRNNLHNLSHGRHMGDVKAHRATDVGFFTQVFKKK
jgi:hypothetical protein